MKLKFGGVFLLFFFSFNTSFSQWYLSKFVIGTFADPRVSTDNDAKKDSISFTLAKLASINLLSGPQFYNGSKDFSLMDKTLGLASKYNMHVLVIDSKLNVTSDVFSTQQAQDIISHFKSMDEDKRKAMGGYYFSGEFPQQKSAAVKKWAGYFKTNDPDKLAYTYLLPCYAFNSKAQYESYLDSYLDDGNSENKPSVVAYDHYPFISDAALKSYFYNLAVIRQKAGTKPVWYYIQSTTKNDMPDITDYQMRFMAYCPLAYGAKGALYYTYESIPDHYGLKYHDALINIHGNVTKKYYLAKFINLYLANVAGPVIMQNKYVGTYHMSTQPTNEQIPADYLLASGNKYIKKISNPYILTGVFKNDNSGKYFLMLINKSDQNAENVTVSLPGNKTVNAFPGSDNYKGSVIQTKLAANASKNGTIFSIGEIPGGEMIVLEIN